MPLPSQLEQFILYLALVAILTALLSSASCSRLHLHSCPTDWGIRMASEQASFWSDDPPQGNRRHPRQGDEPGLAARVYRAL